MNNIQRFFKRYVHSSVKLFCFFILINIVLFVVLAVVSSSRGSHSPTQLLEQVSADLQQSEESYRLSENTAIQMTNENAWCMLISNDTGDVVWNYKIPSELPLHYTPGDIAEMTRWYLEDYPVFVSNQSYGVFGTYNVPFLDGAMRRHLEASMGTLSLDRDSMGLVRKAQMLYHRDGKEMSEIAGELGVSLAEVARAVAYPTHFFSVYDLPIPEEDGDIFEYLVVFAVALIPFSGVEGYIFVCAICAA